MKNYIVVSSDGHAGLKPEEYRSYVDPEFRETFDIALPIQIEQTKIAAKKFLVDEINEDWRGGNERGLSGAWDHNARNEVLDADGIAAEVLFPDGITEMNSPPFGAGISLPTENIVPELQWAGARAHNRWLSEFTSQQPDRRIGIAIVPALWDVDEAIAEVRWAKENGLRGVMLPVQWGKLAGYHDPKYDPLWEAIQDQGLVIHFHSGPAPTAEYFGDLTDPDAKPLPGAMGIYVSEVCWFNVRPLTFMIWGGVFEKFPRLKVAITEGTIVWVPEYLHLLEHRYAQTRESQKLGDYTSHLSMSPTDYFNRNVNLGASCLSRREAEMRNDIGTTNIMWGSDYPHPEGTWPITPEQMHTSLDGLPELDIEAILGRNAIEFYGLDEKDLIPHAERIGPARDSFQSNKA